MSKVVIASDRSNDIEIVRLSQNLGAQIRNLDLSQELTGNEFSIVHQAFLENEVLVFVIRISMRATKSLSASYLANCRSTPSHRTSWTCQS